MAVLFLGLILSIATAVLTHWTAALCTVLLTVFGAVLLAQQMGQKIDVLKKETCSCAEAAVDFTGWRGHVQSFQFKSHKYAKNFASQNQGKLVNVSQDLRDLLSGTYKSPEPVEQSNHAAPPPDNYLPPWVGIVTLLSFLGLAIAASVYALNY